MDSLSPSTLSESALMADYHPYYQQKQELCQAFFQQTIQKKQELAQHHQTIDPTDPRYFLRSNPELTSALEFLTKCIFATLSRFLTFLILPQQPDQSSLRPGYFDVSKQNMEGGFITSPQVSKTIMEYILYDIYPYRPFCDYEPTDVADMGSKNKDPYSVRIAGKSMEIIPNLLFTNENLQGHLKPILDWTTIVISTEAAEAYRLFLRRVTAALLLFVPVGSASTDYLQMVRQLQSQTFIVRGIEMTRQDKLRNAIWWLISAGTDWLSKRNVDSFDLKWALSALLDSSDIDAPDLVLNKVMTLPMPNGDSYYNESEIHQFGLDHHLIVSRDVARRYAQIESYLLTQDELASWLSSRCDLFAQL